MSLDSYAMLRTSGGLSSCRAEFVEYQNEHALKAIHSRSGKRLTMQELDKHRTSEEAKEQQVIAVRLENIKLQNKITKLEELIKKKVCTFAVTLGFILTPLGVYVCTYLGATCRGSSHD